MSMYTPNGLIMHSISNFGFKRMTTSALLTLATNNNAARLSRITTLSTIKTAFSPLRFLSYNAKPLTSIPKPSSSILLQSSLRYKSTTTTTTINNNSKPEEAELSKLSAHDSKASGFKDIMRLFKLAQPERTPMIVALILLGFTSAISMSVPMIIGKFLDAGSSVTHDEQGNEISSFTDVEIYGMSMMQFFGVISGVFIFGAFCNSGRVIILKTIGEKLVARLRTRTLKASLEQDSKFLDNNRVGDLISRLSSDASIVSKSVTQNISDGMRAVISGGVGITMMGLVSWKLTGIMLMLAPPLGVMAFFYGKKIRNLSRQLQTSVGELTKVAEEQLNATRTIQAYGGERLEVAKYSTAVKDVFNIGFKEAYTSGTFYGVTGLIANIGLITLLGIGSSMIKNGSLTVGELSSFMMYAVYTGSSMFGLSNFYSELMKGAGAAARIFELNDRKPEIQTTVGIKPTSQDLSSSIVFQNVQFNYPTRPNIPIFNNLNFEINRGEHVCIVGPSGSGKSTITSLLLRFYDVDSGSILINNKDIKSFNLRAYRKQIGVVQQEPSLFSGTILDNITYNIDTYTESQLQDAMQKANVSKFINEFPQGLQTIVGPKGTQLSGGQRQRISLCRSLLINPQILILDESTSALDTNSEKIIAETLHQRSQDGRTTISIAHRVSTIKHSSRVIVLGKNGDVVETGAFDQLYADSGSELNLLLTKNQEETIELSKDKKSNLELLELEVEEQEFVDKEIDERIKKDLSINQ